MVKKLQSVNCLFLFADRTRLWGIKLDGEIVRPPNEVCSFTMHSVFGLFPEKEEINPLHSYYYIPFEMITKAEIEKLQSQYRVFVTDTAGWFLRVEQEKFIPIELTNGTFYLHNGDIIGCKKVPVVKFENGKPVQSEEIAYHDFDRMILIRDGQGSKYANLSRVSNLVIVDKQDTKDEVFFRDNDTSFRGNDSINFGNLDDQDSLTMIVSSEPFVITRSGDALKVYEPHDAWMIHQPGGSTNGQGVEQKAFPIRIAIGPNAYAATTLNLNLKGRGGRFARFSHIFSVGDCSISQDLLVDPKNAVLFFDPEYPNPEPRYKGDFVTKDFVCPMHNIKTVGLGYCLIRHLKPEHSLEITVSSYRRRHRSMFFTRDSDGSEPLFKPNTKHKAMIVTFDHEGKPSGNLLNVGYQNGFLVFGGVVIASDLAPEDIVNKGLLILDYRDNWDSPGSCDSLSISTRNFSGKSLKAKDGFSLNVLDAGGISCLRIHSLIDKNPKLHFQSFHRKILHRHLSVGLPTAKTAFTRQLSSLDSLKRCTTLTDRSPIFIIEEHLIVGGFVTHVGSSIKESDLWSGTLVCLLPEVLDFEFDPESTEAIADVNANSRSKVLLKRSDVVLCLLEEDTGLKTTIGSSELNKAPLEIIRRKNWIFAYVPKTQRRIEAPNQNSQIPPGYYFTEVNKNGDITLRRIQN